MKISTLVAALLKMKDAEGDMEVTCTGTTLEDNHGGPVPDVFETTVENLVVGKHPTIGKRVRLYM